MRYLLFTVFKYSINAFNLGQVRNSMFSQNCFISSCVGSYAKVLFSGKAKHVSPLK